MPVLLQDMPETVQIVSWDAEAAYPSIDAVSIDAVMGTRNFHDEARQLVLRNEPQLAGDADFIRQAAALLALSFRKQLLVSRQSRRNDMGCDNNTHHEAA